MVDVPIRDVLSDNNDLLSDIRSTLIQSNTRLESVVNSLTMQSSQLAEQARQDQIARETEELKNREAAAEAARVSASASTRGESGPDGGLPDTATRSGLLSGLVTAGLLGVLGAAAYRYFGLDDFVNDLKSEDAFNEFKQDLGNKFDNLIFGEQDQGGRRSGGLAGAIAENPVAAAAAGAGLVTFLMKGARFRALPGAMATFMLGYIGLNAFFNPEGNDAVAAEIDDGIKYLEDNFGTELFNILKNDYGIDVTGEGVVNVLESAAIYKGTSLALRLFGVRGRGKFLIPLAGAMAAFAFNYFGLEEFFTPDNENEMFDFLESETMAEYGSLIAAALGMAAVAVGPGMMAGIATGAAARGKAKAPTGSNALSNRLLGRLPGGGKGALIAIAASAIAAYTFNRLGLDDLFSGEETDLDESLDEAAEEAFQRQIDAAAVGAAVGLGLGAANTRYARRGYVYDRNTRQYRIAPGSSNAGRFASRAVAERTALEAFPKLAKLFRAIPGLSAAFAAYDGFYIITDPNLTVEEKVAMLSGVFGGLSLSVIIGGAGLLVGGPVGGAIGGLAGYFAGDYIVRELLLWVLSDNDDALNRIQSEAERIQGQREQAELNAREYYLEQGRDPSRLDVENVPIGRVSSARLPGATGTIAPGMETSALDVLSERDTSVFDTYIPPMEPLVEPSATPQTDVIPGEINDATARAAAEAYLGRAMSDEEWDFLKRAVYAESSGATGGDYTTEKAMVMATILNRARTGYQDDPRGSVIGALTALNQFQAVTGTPGDRNPSPMFVQGPNAQSSADIQAAAVNILSNISREQTRFTAAATGAYGPGTNIGYRDRMIEEGGTTIGGTVFNTSPTMDLSSLSSRTATPTLTPSALNLGQASKQVNIPVTTVVNNIDNSQTIAGGGGGGVRTASARNVKRDTSYESAAMSQFA